VTFKLPDDKDQALEMAEVAVETLNVIAQIIGGAVATTSAGAITVLRVILATVQEGFEGKITAEQVRHELEKFTTSMSTNDTAADKALEDKFKEKD
jgi:hypothetical protein